MKYDIDLKFWVQILGNKWDSLPKSRVKLINFHWFYTIIISIDSYGPTAGVQKRFFSNLKMSNKSIEISLFSYIVVILFPSAINHVFFHAFEKVWSCFRERESGAFFGKNFVFHVSVWRQFMR